MTSEPRAAGEAPAGSGAPARSVGPAALHARLSEALRVDDVATAMSRDGGGTAASPTPAQCLAAGERLLDRALAGDERSRATALDLLAADALVTRAFELAAERGDDLQRLADEAMARIAAHAADPRTAAP